ncbi:MAG: hypothetical protein OXK79_04475, partial [Chloroflexota bacterium]|nr:hypothetical protein [Chloroflexota bacterium]
SDVLCCGRETEDVRRVLITTIVHVFPLVKFGCAPLGFFDSAPLRMTVAALFSYGAIVKYQPLSAHRGRDSRKGVFAIQLTKIGQLQSSENRTPTSRGLVLYMGEDEDNP